MSFTLLLRRQIQEMIDLDKKFWQWVVVLFLAFIWGSSFILMKKGLTEFSSEQVANIRIVISFLLLLPMAFQNFRQVRKKDWKFLAVVGFCGTGLPAFLFAIAQSKINSSLAGMLNSLVPFFTLILGVTVFGITFKRHRIYGVFIGLIGALGLLGLGFDGSFNGDWRYSLLVVLATICYAISVNVIKIHLGHIKSVAITAISIAMIGPIAVIYLLTTDFISRLSFDSEVILALSAILCLGIFGTAMAVVIFNMLIKRVSPLFAASVTYLIPIFAIMWGFFDDENITALQLISIGVILTGVYLVNKK